MNISRTFGIYHRVCDILQGHGGIDKKNPQLHTLHFSNNGSFKVGLLFCNLIKKAFRPEIEKHLHLTVPFCQFHVSHIMIYPEHIVWSSHNFHNEENYEATKKLKKDTKPQQLEWLICLSNWGSVNNGQKMLFIIHASLGSTYLDAY